MVAALADRNAIYSKEGKYYPLPNPARTMIVYDDKYTYTSESAETLQAALSDRGIAAEIKSVEELTDKDKSAYEIILLRAGTTNPVTGEKLRGVKSKVNWSRSAGETEIVESPFVENTNVYVIGGKNQAAVGAAIEGYVRNYRRI
jgi:hypothetical protein